MILVGGQGVEPCSPDYEPGVVPVDQPPMVDLLGIEPSSSVCNTGAQPLRHRSILVEVKGIEPLFPVCKTDVFPLDDTPTPR